jgi:hypothetical protein
MIDWPSVIAAFVVGFVLMFGLVYGLSRWHR